MTGILEIEEMEFFAYHGCFEAEQTVGNKFKVYACLPFLPSTPPRYPVWMQTAD